MRRSSRLARFLIPCLALALALAACGGAATPVTAPPLASGATSTPLPSPLPTTAITPAPGILESTDAEGHYVLGDPRAPVTIVEYSDFQ